MAVNDGYSIRVGDGHLVRCDAYQLAMLLVEIVYSLVSACPTVFVQVPQVGEFGQEGTWDVANLPVAEIGEDEEEDWCGQ